MTNQAINHFFVVFQRFHSGVEAIVRPDETYPDIVKQLRSGDYTNVVCIHEVADGRATEVTTEMFAAARQERLNACDEAAEWLEGV